MFCDNCGSELPEGALFCSNCGNTIDPAEAGQKYRGNTEIGDTYKNAGQTVKKNAKGRALAVFFSVLAVLFSVSACLIFMVRNALSEKAIDTLVNQLDLAEIEVEFLDDENHSDTLLELTANVVAENYIGVKGDRQIEKDMEELLDEKFVKKYVSKKLNQYVKDLFYETGKGVVKADEIVDLLEDNKDEINKHTHFVFGTEEIEYVMEKMDDEGVWETTDLSEYRDDNPGSFSLIKNGLSYWMAVILLVLAVLLTVGIFLIQADKRKGLIYTGANLIVIGVIDFLIGACSGLIAMRFNSSIGLGKEFWGQLFAPVRSTGITVGVIVAVVGGTLFCAVDFAVKKRHG